MRLGSAFRRYHRQLAIVMCLPLALTIVSGMAYPLFSEWLSLNNVAGFLIQVHSGRIFGLQGIYPFLNGLGLAGLLVTGMSMTSLVRQRSVKDALSNGRSENVTQDLVER